MALPNINDYFVPATREEAFALLDQYGEQALLVAGGTFVHGLEVRGLLDDVAALIDLSRLGLDGISEREGQLAIGATTTFRELLAQPTIASAAAYAAIRDALSYPPAQILNMGTVGGCVAASAPLYDLPCALLALDASLAIEGPDGSRELPLQEFFTGLFENALAGNELISELRLPAAAAGTASAFLKLETNANDLALLNAAVRLSVAGDGKVSDARIWIGGGVGETYARARTAEAAVIGAAVGTASFEAASDAVGNDIQTVDDHRASAAYRKQIAKVYVRRCLETALSRLG